MFKRAGLTLALIVCCVMCMMFVVAASAGVQAQRDSIQITSASLQ